MGHELTGTHRIDPVCLGKRPLLPSGKRRSVDLSRTLNDRLPDPLNECPDVLRLAQKRATGAQVLQTLPVELSKLLLASPLLFDPLLLRTFLLFPQTSPEPGLPCHDDGGCDRRDLCLQLPVSIILPNSVGLPTR